MTTATQYLARLADSKTDCATDAVGQTTRRTTRQHTPLRDTADLTVVATISIGAR